MSYLFKHRDTANRKMETFLDTRLLTGLKANNMTAILIIIHCSTGYQLAVKTALINGCLQQFLLAGQGIMLTRIFSIQLKTMLHVLGTRINEWHSQNEPYLQRLATFTVKYNMPERQYCRY